jgi:hypothetical protein
MPARESTIRNRIQTIVRTVSGITSARVVVGNDDLAASKEFFGDLVSDGVYVLVLPAEQVGYDTGNRVSEVEVRCKVWFGFTANAAYTFADIETTIFAIRDALKVVASWTDCAVPENIRVSLSEVDRTLSPHVGVYEISLSFAV